jgi:hypothetical protein
VLHIYTMDQVNALVSGARANCASDLADISIALRVAQAKEKDWRKYIDALSKSASAPRSRKKEGPVGITKEQASMLRNLLSGRKH